jgi:nitronate monooxygenase
VAVNRPADRDSGSETSRVSKPEGASLPCIIQGGMGAAVSNWVLARTVSMTGQLGVVSGTGLDTVLVRRLQDGDPGGHLRRAIARFPIPDVGERILRKYFRPDGRRGAKYALLPMYDHRVSTERHLVAVLGNFVEVFLAKEGHEGPVGINLLTKIQPPTLSALYGAMLAGVNVVLMGAGIPRDIPGALDRLAVHEPAAIHHEVTGDRDAPMIVFDPRLMWGAAEPTALERPRFYAIIASNLLATMLARKATGKVDGFVVEGPTAGGHNAPPRGTLQLNERGEPVYGERDVVDLAAMRELGVPFWIAGGAGSPEALACALKEGAAGIQVGTLFAFCEESGLDPEFKRAIVLKARAGLVEVMTDPRASPTGYPFKVVRAPGVPSTSEGRERVCDLGMLRTAFRRENGSTGYRCPAEPVEDYVKKGGQAEDTEGRRCLCNALLANIGMGQVREHDTIEPPLFTSGDDLVNLRAFLGDRERYSAGDVLAFLLGGVSSPVVPSLAEHSA